MIEALVNVLVQQNESGLYVVNSSEREVKEKVAIVGLYTNVELLEDDYLNYDILSMCGLINYFEDHLDVFTFSTMLNDRIEDRLTENSMEYMFARKIDNAINILDNTMHHVNGMLDKGDPNIIAKYLSKGIEDFSNMFVIFSNLAMLI